MTDKKTQSLGRALQVAAETFSHRRFDSVSVLEIAEASRCSTATIYNVYGSKENLFLAAMTHVLQTSERPLWAGADEPLSLFKLLTFTESRARYLCDPTTRSITRAMLAKFDMVKPVMNSVIGEYQAYVADALITAIGAAVDDGLLRPLEPDVIAYNIMAGTTYEPFVVGITFGDETAVLFNELIRKVFTPLVSPEGERQLQAFLARVRRSGHAVRH